MEINDNNTSIELGWPARYQIKKELAKGALGRLFLARDQQLEKEVLVKIASPWASRDSLFKSYVYDRWAEKEALLEHPNIAGIIEVGKRGGCYYLVTEYPGEHTLADELKGAPLDNERAVDLLHQVSEALRAVHRREIACGHLKPSDVYITTDPAGHLSVKLMLVDMGVDSRSAAGTLLGETFGTPRYMAPEVIQGKQPSPQSDIFALGVMGYEMLTGKGPFSSEHPIGYLFANCRDEAAPPHHLVSSIPRELSMTVMRCIEKEPARRYRSVQRVIDDLERCRNIIQTGICEVVPRGTDSALARDYDLPAREARKEKGAATSRLAYVALILALAAAVVTLAANSPVRQYLQRAATTVITDNGEADANGPEVSVTPPETGFDELYRRTVARWERRHRPTGNYTQAIEEFTELAAGRLPGPQGRRAIEQAVAIYIDWAETLARNKRFDEAEEKYLSAQELAPEGSEYEHIYYERLPQLLLFRAEDALKTGNFTEAREKCLELLERFPNAEASREAAQLLPVIMLARAQHKWNSGETAAALQLMEDLTEEYPGTDQGAEAARLIGQLHADKVRLAVEEGDIALLEEHMAILENQFPDSDALETVRDLAPDIAFAYLRSYLEAGDTAAADRALANLMSDFPDSVPAYEAARLRAGLAPDAVPAPDDLMEEERAENMLSAARDAMEENRPDEAEGYLEDIVRKTAGDSAAGRRALQLLPESAYKAAVRAYGTGAAEGFRKRMEHIAGHFVFSPWATTAQTTLRQYDNTPEGMAYVPAGKFIMGADRSEIIARMKPYHPERIIESEDELNMILQLEGYVSEMPSHHAEAGPFYIDITPVTKSQYKEFIDETGHRPPSHWTDGEFRRGREEFPVTNVSLFEAQAYARWAGKRLATEAEWEKAARGVDGRIFPWGNRFEDGRAHHLQSTMAGPLQAGSHPQGKSPYGVLDMIGNVCEWTTSFFLPYKENSISDHRAPYSEEYVVIRSGAWDMDDMAGVPTSASRRLPWEPEEPARFIGFRCVKDCE